MCGISGFLDGTGRARDSFERLAVRMSDTLRHRGPDDSGAWVDPAAGIALSHRRLSILDLSPEGRQPMRSHDGRYVTVFNGEIYNFQELRAELAACGYTFRGHSDTEVMLACFCEWGIAAATARLNGMFAFAVWDCREKRLWLARDRMGKKPLYYGWSGGIFLFGSELKSLAGHPCFSAEIDRGALALYLRHGYIPAPCSIYRGIFKLPPGTIAEIVAGRGEAVPVPYWSARDAVQAGRENPLGGPPEDLLAQLEALLDDAVRRRMISDVPLGAFLSGGIDSSVVVALMQRVSSAPVKTFSIGFREQTWDEAPYARAVARHLGTDHTELYVTPEEAMAVVPRLPALFDEPFGDSSQIPTFLVCKLARTAVTVSLSGDGGDELFGGYHAYFTNENARRRYLRLPRPLAGIAANGLRGASAVRRDSVWRDRARRLASLLDCRTEPAVYRHLMSLWWHPSALVPDAPEPATVFTQNADWMADLSFQEKMMYLDSVCYLPDDILVKVDRSSMGVSLEARCPLLDYRVFELAWRIPAQWKFRGGVGKWLLRELAFRHVPKALLDRPKSGFAVPVGDWLRGPLRAWAEGLLDGVRRDGIVDVRPVREKWDEHLRGAADRSFELWDILMFQAWYEAACTPKAGAASACSDSHP